jgi:hypothetical protein
MSKPAAAIIIERVHSLLELQALQSQQQRGGEKEEIVSGHRSSSSSIDGIKLHEDHSSPMKRKQIWISISGI